MRKQQKTVHLQELYQVVRKLKRLLDEEDILYRSERWNRRKDRTLGQLEAWLMKYTDFRLAGDNIILIGGLADIYLSKTNDAFKLKKMAGRTLKEVELGKNLEEKGWGAFPELPRERHAHIKKRHHLHH